jgi:hypothetical protein
MQQHLEDADDDILWEVPPIAREIKRNERQTYYLLQTGAIPARKVGGKWVASRKKLRAALTGE